MDYAKIINGELIYAPSDVFYEEEDMVVHMMPPSEEWLISNGFKPVVENEYTEEEGYEYIPSYVETDEAIEIHYDATVKTPSREVELSELTSDELRQILTEYSISTSMTKQNMIKLILSVEATVD